MKGRRVVRWVLITSAIAFALAVALLVFLIVDFPGRASDHLIREATSADGRLVAELHEIVTPMHGGPDMMQVTLKAEGDTTGDVVYSHTFECGPDYSGYQLRWNSPESLTVVHGTCDAGRYRSAEEKGKSQQLTTWHAVRIDYKPSDHIARAER